MGVLVIRVLAAGALTREETRHFVAEPTVASIGSRRDHRQDLRSGNGLRFLEQDLFADNLVEASLQFALSNAGVSSVLAR